MSFRGRGDNSDGDSWCGGHSQRHGSEGVGSRCDGRWCPRSNIGNEVGKDIAAVQSNNRLSKRRLVFLGRRIVPTLRLGIRISKRRRVSNLCRCPELGSRRIPKRGEGRVLVLCGAARRGKCRVRGRSRRHETRGVEILPDGPHAVHVGVVKPEERVKGRYLERRHVAAAAHSVVDLVVHVFETAKGARARVGVPSVEAEGVKVAVREEEETDVASEGGKLVGEDGGDA